MMRMRASLRRSTTGSPSSTLPRNLAVPPLSSGQMPPPDTIPGAFVRDLEARIGQAEAAGRADEAAELRDALRLGRLLLLDDPARVTLV